MNFTEYQFSKKTFVCEKEKGCFYGFPEFIPIFLALKTNLVLQRKFKKRIGKVGPDVVKLAFIQHIMPFIFILYITLYYI